MQPHERPRQAFSLATLRRNGFGLGESIPDCIEALLEADVRFIFQLPV